MRVGTVAGTRPVSLNRKWRLGSNITTSAVLLDQEPGWAVTDSTNQSYIDAMTRKADLIYNATLDALPHVSIDMFGWGCVEPSMGMSKHACPGPEPWGHADPKKNTPGCSPNGNTAAGKWCGLVDQPYNGGWGNEDVRPCGCNGYTLSSMTA